jgi:hypothetical protein
MRHVAWLMLALPLVLAAKPTSYDDPDALLRQADAAYESHHFDRAAELYDRAGVRTTEPARAAFNLATARYRQAKDGQPAALGEAEVNYRACLRPGCEFRARALYGLGNCLLIRASGATLDRATLRAAIDRFSECLAAADDGSLKADARHNRMKARLLLLQAPAPQEGSQDEPQGDEKKEDDPDDPHKKNDKDSKTDGNGGLTPAKDKAGKDAKETKTDRADGQQASGKSVSLPPIRDSGESMPLAKGDAERYVDEAVRRIRDEAAAYKKSKARPAGAGVKDW